MLLWYQVDAVLCRRLGADLRQWFRQWTYKFESKRILRSSNRADGTQWLGEDVEVLPQASCLPLGEELAAPTDALFLPDQWTLH